MWLRASVGAGTLTPVLAPSEGEPGGRSDPMSDEATQREPVAPEAEGPRRPHAWAHALQGPDGGPDDADAVHDLSGFPDAAPRPYRWRG